MREAREPWLYRRTQGLRRAAGPLEGCAGNPPAGAPSPQYQWPVAGGPATLNPSMVTQVGAARHSRPISMPEYAQSPAPSPTPPTDCRSAGAHGRLPRAYRRARQGGRGRGPYNQSAFGLLMGGGRRTLVGRRRPASPPCRALSERCITSGRPTRRARGSFLARPHPGPSGTYALRAVLFGTPARGDAPRSPGPLRGVAPHTPTPCPARGVAPGHSPCPARGPLQHRRPAAPAGGGRLAARIRCGSLLRWEAGRSGLRERVVVLLPFQSSLLHGLLPAQPFQHWLWNLILFFKIYLFERAPTTGEGTRGWR